MSIFVRFLYNISTMSDNINNLLPLPVKNLFGHCPRFEETREYEPILANRAIEYLKPSEMTTNPILVWIKKIFNKVLDWLFPFQKTNYVGIVAALDAANSQNSSLTATETLSYLRRFYEDDGSKPDAVTSILTQLEEQYSELAMPSSGVWQAHKERIADIQEGNQCVIITNDQRGDELFYLFSKREGELSLKIVGRGESMAQLTPDEIMIAGEAKITSLLSFKNVDVDFANRLLDASPVGKRYVDNKENIESLAQLVEGRFEEPEDHISHLATKTDRLFKVFGRVIEEVEKNVEYSAPGDDLRLEIFTLFSMLKEYRHTFSQSPVESAALSRMLYIAWQHVSQCYHEKQLSADETEALVKELKLVEEMLTKTDGIDNESLSNIETPAMSDLYAPQHYQPLTATTPISSLELTSVQNPRAPCLVCPEENNDNLVFDKSLIPVQGEGSILDELRRLVANEATPQEIVHGIGALDFSVFEGSHYERVESTSPWAQLTREEAKEVMDQLHLLSRRCGEFAVEEKELPIDVYETLMKMSFMILFLTHHTMNNGRWSRATYDLSSIIFKQGAVIASGHNFHSRGRYGYALYSTNIRSYQQLYRFYWNMLGLHNRGSDEVDRWQASENSMPEESSLYQQVDLLEYLTPSVLHEFVNIEGGEIVGCGCIFVDSKMEETITSAIHGWIPPQPPSLLAAYHKVVVQSKDSGFSEEDEEYRNTPEAIQHDPLESLQKWGAGDIDKKSDWWQRFLENDILRLKAAPDYRFGSKYTRGVDSAFEVADWEKRLQWALKKVDGYSKRSSGLDMQFTKEESTSLLSLLKEDPQSEVLSFLETHTSMLANPAVRSFVQMLFFQDSLTKVFNYTSRHNHGMFNLAPQLLKEKVEMYKEKVLENPEEISIFLFFLQMSERLQGIYTNMRFSTDDFYSIQEGELQTLLQSELERDPSAPVGAEILAMQLQVLLAKPSLSQGEFSQVILHMDQLQTKLQQISSFDYRELFWIRGDYQKLINQIDSQLSKEHLNYVLDTICYRRNLRLDGSSWEGEFPCFQNGQYRINLKRGEVENIALESIARMLPTSISGTPDFKKIFPEFNSQEIRTFASESDEGTITYHFQDRQKKLVSSCRERRGMFLLPLFSQLRAVTSCIARAFSREERDGYN